MALFRWMTPALLTASLAGFAMTSAAQECSVTVETNDTLAFQQKVITVDPSCKEFEVKLVHGGKLAKNVMGHNWVLSKPADAAGIAGDGLKAGLENNYLKSGDDRIIASTKIIGSGEETSVSFSTDKLSADEEYIYFCSFPGHSTVMRGTLAIKES
jgi:azurin